MTKGSDWISDGCRRGWGIGIRWPRVARAVWGSASTALLCVMVSACGGGGGSDAASPSSGEVTAPVISTQPLNLVVTEGDPASFSVAADGTPPLTYEWRRDGVPIAGANGPSYLLSATTTADSGARFVAIVSNGAGSASSTAALLTVNAAPSPATEFAAAANPLRVTIQAEPAGAVSSVIPSTGGTLQVTAANGTRFTLTVPDKTFSSDTRITLTPVTAISGLPFAAGSHAVRVDPADARLSQLATLRIEPSKVPVPANRVLFSVRGGDQGELHFLPPVSGTGAIEARLAHFGVVGVAAATGTERAATRARLPTLLADRWSHIVADRIPLPSAGLTERRQSLGTPGLPAVADAYAAALLGLASVIPGDCEQAWFYIDTTLRQGILVTQSVPGAFTSTFVQVAFAQVGSLINASTTRCLQELKQQCLDHDLRALVPMVQWKAAIEVWVQPLLPIGFSGFDFADQAGRLIDGCARFDLEFNSTGTGIASTGQFEAQVRTQMALRLTGPTLPLRWFGSAPLEAQRFVLAGAGGILTTTYIGTAPAAAQELRLIPDNQALINVPAPNFPITNLELDYNPGRDLATVLFIGPNGITIPAVFDGLWLATYTILHADEYGENGQTIKDWQFIGGELYARKPWSRSLEVNGTITENTLIELYHRPVLP